MNNSLTAYVDESLRSYDGQATYYLCAILDRGITDDAIANFKELKPHDAKKLHWRDMGVELQKKSLKTIETLSMDTIVVSGRPVNSKKQERARRKCLELLLPLLGSAGVKRAVLESRTDSLDKRDREMAVNLTRKGWLSNVTVAHQRGEDEPRLWIPDQIIGAKGHVDAKTAAPN